MGRVFTSYPVLQTVPAAYVGPGDVTVAAAASVEGWWGLRAYAAASIGTNAIRLREDGGNTEQDFPTVAGGGLNLSAISTFKGANNLFVTKLYDQTGNGNDLAQATAASQPTFTLAGLGLLPIMTFIRASATQLFTPSAFTINQPYSLTSVARTVGSNGGAMFSARTLGNQGQFGFVTSADQVYIYAGAASPLASCTRNAFHALGAVFNVASSQILVDGTSTAVDLASGNNMPDALGIGSDLAGSTTGLEGQIQEFGVWTTTLTGTQFTNLSSNQHTYWGF